MIRIIDYTKQPLSMMGEVASTCWNSKPSQRIGKECIENGHGRVAEFADVVVEIDGYSARAIRELYTHISGTSRLQSSTRYIKYGDFDYYTPPKITNNKHAIKLYEDLMYSISETYKQLEDLGIPKEDIANVLPLGSHSKMVLKINIRALIHFSNMRLCGRALLEIRQLTRGLLDELSKLNDEYKYIVDNYCVPKCVSLGYCNEKFSCGLKPKKESD